MSRKQLCLLVLIAFGLVVLSNSQSFGQEDIAEAVAVGEELAIADATPTTNSGVRPLTVAAGLLDDTVITGTLMDSTTIDIRTAFGEANIPLAEVAGIRFPGGDDVATTVVMLNGDSITGATDLKFASVETTWGSAKINGQNIATLLFVPGLRWEAMESLGGKRWQLVEANAPQQSSVQPASASNPIRNQSGPQTIQNQTIQNQPVRSQPINGQPIGGPIGQPFGQPIR